MVIIIAAEMFDWLVMRQGNGISVSVQGLQESTVKPLLSR